MWVAIWIFPLALLFFQGSPWAVVAAMVAGWNLGKQFRPLDTKHVHFCPGMFGTYWQLDSTPLVPSPVALCSATCLQTGAAGLHFGGAIASAILLGIGSASIAWSMDQLRTSETRITGQSAFRPVIAAALLTLVGLLHYVPFGSGGETSGSSGPPTETADVSPKSAVPLDGIYKGVILQPETAPHVVLVPPLPYLRKGLFSHQNPKPLSVPFFGSYWMFRWPFSRPPADSYVLKGSPLSSTFRSADAKALQMEAHQNFGTLIELSCCSKIQVVLQSADGPVSIALSLTNTTLPERPTIRLGEFTIDSNLDPSQGSPVPLQIVVPFDVPLNPRITEFDEATIVFHKEFARVSAKVAIDRFIFVPRGR